ncbi:MAG: Gx transporter family protein [Clostridiales bacterium]|nr:Gx transporter family protein [Clostridiales bacterium]
MKNRTAKLTAWGVMTALSLVLTVAEAMIIPAGLFPIPGFRLGLSNIVILISVYLFGAIPSVGIVLLRTLAVFAFGGNLSAFLFSLCGGLLAVFAMLVLRQTKLFSLFGVSAGGAAAHSIGQISAGAFLTGSARLFLYLPFLLWASIAAGLLIALLSVPIYRALDAFFKAPGSE